MLAGALMVVFWSVLTLIGALGGVMLVLGMKGVGR